jgi:para-nitrobenzyl esterase
VFDPVELEPHENVNTENCLTLNIWAPADAGSKKAVMVFIHGGGFVVGGSKEQLYDGKTLATFGDVVIVNLNYRLGLLGFLDFSVIGGAEYTDSANNGLLDQLTALQWVQDNIAAFGGDPQNVTIFGESAGGASVSALLGIDQPQRYFRRLIIMSGSPLHPAEVSASIASLIRDETGISFTPVWKYAPTVGITYIQDQVTKAVGSPVSDLLFAPTYGDNNIVKHAPLEAARQGATQGIDLMVGTMANELTYWEFYDTETDHICDQNLADNLITYIDPGQADRVRQLYDLYKENPEYSGYSEAEILMRMEGDYVFRLPAVQLAEAQSKNGATYVYQVEYPVNLPDHPCQNNRSPHGSELWFVFGKINEAGAADFIGLPRDAQDASIQERLMNEMMTAWVNFAKTGNPNGGALPDWPLFNPETQPVMRFGVATRSENAPFQQETQAMLEFTQTFNLFDVLK